MGRQGGGGFGFFLQGGKHFLLQGGKGTEKFQKALKCTF